MFHEFNGMFRRRHESVRRTGTFRLSLRIWDCFLIARSDDLMFMESLETCWNARRGTNVEKDLKLAEEFWDIQCRRLLASELTQSDEKINSASH